MPEPRQYGWGEIVVAEELNRSLSMPKSGFAKEALVAFIERIEKLEEEKKAITDDIKEVYSEAKGTGFDTKIMKQIIALRKLDSSDRLNQEAMLDLYKSAVGMRP